MDVIEKILADFPSAALCARLPRAAAVHKHPRDAVAALINNSIALYENPNHTVKKRGKDMKPETCIRASGIRGQYIVSLNYCRRALPLYKGKEAIEIDEQQLKPLLTALRDAVGAGHFDAQLEVIRDERSAKLKDSRKPKRSTAQYDEAKSY